MPGLPNELPKAAPTARWPQFPRHAKMSFPVFAFGSYGQDSSPRYKVHDFRVPVEIGQARIEPGDILFGDIDGVCVIPRRAEVDIFSMAFEKARGEKLVKKDLEQGISAAAAFARHGIM